MKANTIVGALAVFLVLPLSGCGRPDDPEPVKSPFDTVLIVLGNEPLDDQTPTVDTIARVAKAVAFQEENPATLKSAEPLACRVDRADSIAQMEAYLKTHDSARVRRRLQQLKKGVKGVD